MPKLHLESLVILQQTMRDQLEKIKSKPGVLKKQLFNLSIGDLEEYPRFGAFERLRAAVFAREQGEFANHIPSFKLNTSLHQSEMA